MLVYIRDEDGFSKMININRNDELKNRYRKILLDGVCLESFACKELIYYYFGSSGSQMKEQDFWCLAPTKVKSTNAAYVVNEARIALGDLKKIQNIATYIARVGLYLTTTKSTDEDIPSVYQVRIAGCKGMLSIDSQSTMNDDYIKVRKSMMEFNSDDWTLEIVDHSRLNEVLVTKNPCLYSGDLRRLEAVDIPTLRPFIHDCIVFPVVESRPHSNEIAGSDLDGDQYWVYWGKELKVNKIISPLAYTPMSKTRIPKITSELIVTHILDILDDQKFCIISNTHAVIVDKHSNGTMSTECKFLAELFPRAIDSIKTGEQIDMKIVNKLRETWYDTYPIWMMKDDKLSYESQSINGYLFNKAQNLRIKGLILNMKS
ncbi:unnamed protein product [Rotaria sp. Silwood2]|nr:unnamed protein product [Rotaria sp. Silwood2]